MSVLTRLGTGGVTLTIIALAQFATADMATAAEDAAVAAKDCTVTAYKYDSADDARVAAEKLEDTAPGESLNGGTHLAGASSPSSLKIPADSRWVIVLDSANSPGNVEATVTAFGGLATPHSFNESVPDDKSSKANGASRIVMGPWKLSSPHSSRLHITASNKSICAVDVHLVTSGSPLVTPVSLVGGATALLAGATAVLFARRTRDSRAVNAAIAVALGVAAGVGQVAVLYETGAIAPQAKWGLVVPMLVGLLILGVALLPQRARQRKVGAPWTNLRGFLDCNGRPRPEQSLAVLRGVLISLAALHNRGWVHRDVSPDLVVFDQAGSARLVEGAAAGPAGPSFAPMGPSTLYRSPEQLQGQPLDARSDVYSCGVLLAELCMGANPFAGATPAATAHNHLAMAVPDLSTVAGVPGPLARIVEKALAKDPTQRFANATEFGMELDAVAVEVLGPDWLTRGALAGNTASNALVGATAATAASVTSTMATPAMTPFGVTLLHVLKAGVVTAAVAAIAVAAVAIEPNPSSARASLLVTPEQARVIFTEIWAQVRQASDSDNGLPTVVTSDAKDSVRNAGRKQSWAIDILQVDVPRQTQFPATFTGYADLIEPGEENHERDDFGVIAEFTREEADQPWKMSGFLFSNHERELPKVDGDNEGYAPPADKREPVSLLIEPSELPGRYAGYLDEGINIAPQGDEVFANGSNTNETVDVFREMAQANSSAGVFFQTHFTAGDLGAVDTRVDGSVQAEFTMTGTSQASNSDGNVGGEDCASKGYITPTQGWEGVSPGEYRAMSQTETFTVTALIPNQDFDPDAKVEIISVISSDRNVSTTPC